METSCARSSRSSLSSRSSECFPLKKKRDRVLTAAERDHALAHGLSLETRARRKRDLAELRKENDVLKEERAEFLSKIEELETAAVSHAARADRELLSENCMLRAQIEEHGKFIAKFLELMEKKPRENTSEKVVYEEGADAAQAYLMSLVSESQEKWLRLKIPKRFQMIGRLENLQMSYQIGRDEARVASDSNARMSIRFDCWIKNVKPEVVANLFWRTYCLEEDSRKMYRNDCFHLKPVVEGLMPDPHTKVVHFTNEFNGEAEKEDCVFVVNRQRKLLAKSTLTPPKISAAGRAGGKAVFPLEDFGRVSAICVATTSTTLRPKETISTPQNRVESLVTKGNIIWEEYDGSRVVMIYSFPTTHKMINAIDVNEIITAKGKISGGFIDLVTGVAEQFTSMLEELGKRVLAGEISSDDLEVSLDVPDQTSRNEDSINAAERALGVSLASDPSKKKIMSCSI